MKASPLVDKVTFYRECAESDTKCSQCRRRGLWKYTETIEGIRYYKCECGNTAIYMPLGESDPATSLEGEQ